ncbi:MAG: DUF4263 domain-containing protein [Chloroherpetonaceae bacterium]|nr:DUF4263 domain-containing protein [Chloroherpetonaceae bacterium]
MRILVITNQGNNEYSLRNELSDLCEGDSLTFCNSFHSAKDFINNYIVEFQSPLDLIITYSIVGYERSEEFKNWLRKDFERTYSKRDFNLNEMPICLIVSSEENKTAFHNYDLTIDDIGIDKIHLFTSDFISTIKSWRKSVLNELDLLGIRFNSGIIDYSKYFSEKRKTHIGTKILSENFKLFPRKLNYYWLNFNTKQIEKSIDEFIKLLKRSSRIGKKGEEKVYHKFFRENKYFLLRDSFSRYWYEPRLMKNEVNYEEPDFFLKPNFNYRTDLNLLEIKLPNETFMKSKKRHNAPLSKLIEHIIQVNDYKDYIESAQNKTELNKIFGMVPQKISYNILIGRKEEKDQRIFELEKIMRQLNQGYIHLMTYDELMEYQVKFFDKMNLLEIR